MLVARRSLDPEIEVFHNIFFTDKQINEFGRLCRKYASYEDATFFIAKGVYSLVTALGPRPFLWVVAVGERLAVYMTGKPVVDVLLCLHIRPSSVRKATLNLIIAKSLPMTRQILTPRNYCMVSPIGIAGEPPTWFHDVIHSQLQLSISREFINRWIARGIARHLRRVMPTQKFLVVVGANFTVNPTHEDSVVLYGTTGELVIIVLVDGEPLWNPSEDAVNANPSIAMHQLEPPPLIDILNTSHII